MLIELPHITAKELFGQYDLADVLMGLNRACCRWSKGEFNSDLPILKEMGQDSNALLWAAAEAARCAVRWCREPDLAHSGQEVRWLRPEHLDALVGVALELMMDGRFLGSAEARAQFSGRGAHDLFQHIVAPQQLLRRSSNYRAGQALLMYGEAAQSRRRRRPAFPVELHDEAIRKVLGCNIESFVLAVQQAQGRSQGEESHITADALIPWKRREYDDTALWARSTSGMLRSAAGAVLDVLSATPATARSWMTEAWLTLNPAQRGQELLEDGEGRVVMESPNPLHRYPLVRVFRGMPDHCIAPVPPLLNEWLYESLADYLHEKCDWQEHKRLDELFEEYVGMIAELCSPDGAPWLHEDQIMPVPPTRVVDWARAFNDTVVLVEAKKGYVTLAKRYRSEGADWQNVWRTNWAKAVEQATVFWEAVKRGEVAALARSRHKRAIVVVVTLADTDLRARQSDVHDAAVFPHISANLPPGVRPLPYVIVSVDRFEQIVSAWTERDAEWLPHVLSAAVASSGKDAFQGIPLMSTGRLVEAFDKVVEDLCAAVSSADEGGGSLG